MALGRKIVFPHQIIATAIKAKQCAPFTSRSKERGVVNKYLKHKCIWETACTSMCCIAGEFFLTGLNCFPNVSKNFKNLSLESHIPLLAVWQNIFILIHHFVYY